MNRIAVYCGSATPADPSYIECAALTGRTLAGRGIGTVYGGGKLGLMGAVADAALAAGGEVIGKSRIAALRASKPSRGCTSASSVSPTCRTAS
jgi:predicted Rossmann-fold nucleotide-binding protein